MSISKVLFATRIGRMLPPLLCLVLASAALVLGGPAGVAVSIGLVLAAVLYKVAAELSGRLTRLDSRRLAAQRDAEAAFASVASLAGRIHAMESKLDALAEELLAAEQRTAARLSRLEKGHQMLVDQISHVVEGIPPARRHVLFEGETMPDLSLRSSTEMLLRRFGQE